MWFLFPLISSVLGKMHVDLNLSDWRGEVGVRGMRLGVPKLKILYS